MLKLPLVHVARGDERRVEMADVESWGGATKLRDGKSLRSDHGSPDAALPPESPRLPSSEQTSLGELSNDETSDSQA